MSAPRSARPDSPPASYAAALAALVDGDDAAALAAAERMRPAGDAFARAADAIAALAGRDAAAVPTAIAAIVADFAARDAHLTGVADRRHRPGARHPRRGRGIPSGVRRRCCRRR